jgi:hypothetical protein
MYEGLLFIATLPDATSLAYINSRCASGDTYWDLNCKCLLIFFMKNCNDVNVLDDLSRTSPDNIQKYKYRYLHLTHR